MEIRPLISSFYLDHFLQLHNIVRQFGRESLVIFCNQIRNNEYILIRIREFFRKNICTVGPNKFICKASDVHM